MATPTQIRRRGLASLILGGLVATVLFAAVAYADTQAVDNDLASPGLQNNVNLAASPGATVNTSAQLVITRQGGNHLDSNTDVTFTVDASQTTLPTGYSVANVVVNTGTWTVNGQQVSGFSSISFTAPTTPGEYTYAVKWTTTVDFGNKLTGAPAFVINLTVTAPTNNAPLIDADNATVTVDEGTLAMNTGTWSDADAGDTVTLSASVGTVVKSGTNAGGTWSWSYTPDDGPSDSQTVTITANDGTTQSQAQFQLVANNVAPTVGAITGPTNVLTGVNYTYSTSATDPSGADTTAGFNWAWDTGSGSFGAYSASATTSSTSPAAQFANCGSYTIRAKAKDKDNGESAPASLVVASYDAAFRSPLRPGVYNMVQKGQVVPVKIEVGCSGFLSGLTPGIQMLSGDVDPDTDPGDGSINVPTESVSGTDTNGVMREVDSQYIYNLRVPSASAGQKYTIRVQPFGPGGGSMYIVLQIRK